jgi:prepilin-type N-terminal cleavage/methylation domain-containing protein
VHRRTRAFTLVELLVALGIIAILLAILVPAVGRIRLQGKELLCVSRSRNVGAAILTYVPANKGQFPSQLSHYVVDVKDPDSWVYKLRKYLAVEDNYRCTLATRSGGLAAEAEDVSFIYNAFASGYAPNQQPAQLRRVSRPSETILIMDQSVCDSNAWVWMWAEEFQRGSFWWYPHPNIAVDDNIWINCLRRSVCYVDGHCESVERDTLQQWQLQFPIQR